MSCTLKTSGLLLSSPSEKDLSAITHFEQRNKEHLAPWESSALNLEETLQKRLEGWIRECKEDRSVRFVLVPLTSPHLIIGFCHFTQIFRGAFQACYLGYKIDHAYEGKGLMFEALEACIQYMFEKKQIHRIMANYMPRNVKSAKLLKRLGFTMEGYAKNYLYINHRWEDHLLTSLTFESWKNRTSVTQAMLSSAKDKTLFREAQPRDALFLTPLMKQLGYPIDEAALKKNIEAYLCRPNQKAWIAEQTGMIIGCVATAITHYLHRPGSFLRILILIVDQKHRRSGIGKSLMNLVERFAQEQGCSHVELTSGTHRESLGSHEFYQSLGYIDLHNTKKYFGKIVLSAPSSSKCDK